LQAGETCQACTKTVDKLIFVDQLGGTHNWVMVPATNHWLVVLTILKNISQWEGLSRILWKIKND
jgi:hypothetical protein